jgi:ethanolamine ammonia-lyase small subunit
LRTQDQLELRLSQARARDAIYRNFDTDALASTLNVSGISSLKVSTQAKSREEYLMNPNLGRHLDASSSRMLRELRSNLGERELVIVVSDGLSALAAERQVIPLLTALLPQLKECRLSYYPVLLASLARVKLGDAVGETLGAALSLVLVGERPGLSSPDSLGAYITYGPGAERTDAERNCISNIREAGLTPAVAARKIVELLMVMRCQRLSGVKLTLEAKPNPLPNQT